MLALIPRIGIPDGGTPMSLIAQFWSLRVLMILLLVLAGCAMVPPVQEMSDARQALAAAQEAGADEYAATRLNEARRLLAAAERYLQEGNANGYWSARRAALDAKETAFDALLISRTAREQAAGEPPGSTPR